MEGFHIDKLVDDIETVVDDLSTRLSDMGFGGERWDPEAEREGAEGSNELIEQEFDVGPNPGLTVQGISGRIAVRAGSGSTIRVRARQHGSPRARAQTRIDFRQEGSWVTIQSKGDPSSLLGVSRQASRVDYDIVVPAGCTVHAKTVSADIRVEGTRAPVQLETVSGDVFLRGALGDCRITTVSGDVTTGDVEGALTLRTTSGDARVSESRLNHFNLNSVSGDFVVETPLMPGQHYLAKTVSGDLQMLVPPGTGATISMKTISGDVSSRLPAEIIKSGRRHWQGRINGGGANVEMNSVSGDLRFGESHGSTADVAVPPEPPESPTAPESVFEPAAPPEPPGPPPTPYGEIAPAPPKDEAGDDAASQENTSSILKALERGEITVEEAMARLDALQ